MEEEVLKELQEETRDRFAVERCTKKSSNRAFLPD
jgi:hypothetical protein